MNEYIAVIYYSTSVIDVMASNIRLMRERIAIDMDNLATYDTSESVTGVLTSSDSQNLVNRYQITYDPDFDEICDLIVFVNQDGLNCGFMRLYDTVNPSLSKDFQITLNYDYIVQYNNIEVSYTITRNENVTNIVAPIYDTMHSSYYDTDYIKTVQVFDTCNDYEDVGINLSSSQIIIDGKMIDFSALPDMVGKVLYSGLNKLGKVTITSIDSSNNIYINGVKKCTLTYRSNGITFAFINGSSYTSSRATEIVLADYEKVLTDTLDLIDLNNGFHQSANRSLIYPGLDPFHGIFFAFYDTNLPIDQFNGSYLDKIHPSFKESNQVILGWIDEVILSKDNTYFYYWYKNSENVSTQIQLSFESTDIRLVNKWMLAVVKEDSYDIYWRSENNFTKISNIDFMSLYCFNIPTNANNDPFSLGDNDLNIIGIYPVFSNLMRYYE